MEGVLQRRCPWAMTSIANHDFSLLPIWPSRGSANLGERQERKERDVHMTFLLDYKWDGLRSNERFQKLLSRVVFPTSWSLAGA
jgi:hypothetical protein